MESTNNDRNTGQTGTYTTNSSSDFSSYVGDIWFSGTGTRDENFRKYVTLIPIEELRQYFLKQNGENGLPVKPTPANPPFKIIERGKI